MASLNRVILIGNLTRDPELRSTPSGASVTNFGIAVNRHWTNKQGERVESVDFFNIVCWGKLAELVSQNITKGTPVAIDGRLQYRAWETSEGQKRSTVEVIAENVQFLGRASSQAKDKDFEPDFTSDAGTENADVSLDEDIPF
ncbi:single-stranded DNA-binding protein [Candidatus Oleimmundimicrobium sp.]|uniref:single-stranded DNA-binding protein n=1 Tax=Candidatus Oleimmundimicrobium sp. TaxID=3060597 RepID=UPI002715AF49|nr:single-stranded DNA-binding protein [Candidatus Oleimmundimicrobium sp.]MDO8885598.1 single-stranded DNA-binding protein [Candidatus Oleimmundimicrobium sp.]